jgi:flagellar assembly factor FliW
VKQKLSTTRFGDFEIDEERIIHFPDGILGFPQSKNYVLLEHKPESSFVWLQSLDLPELAFVTINPFLVSKDYVKSLSLSERSLLRGTEEGETLLLSLVTIPPGEAEKMTANLLGPLVIRVKDRIGKQVILANSGYNHRHPLIPS